jgi:6-pyruvoyltetrahydropterin/6-carboxytetrahydropterin synthase
MTQISICRQHTISVGHRVAGHLGKCANFHGHNFTIHIFMQARDGLDDVGRVLDFGIMKASFCEWLDQCWDHKFLLWSKDPLVAGIDKPGELCHPSAREALVGRHLPGIVLVDFNPTAENMAAFLLKQFNAMLVGKYNVTRPDAALDTLVTVTGVRVDETAKCFALASAE